MTLSTPRNRSARGARCAVVAVTLVLGVAATACAGSGGGGGQGNSGPPVTRTPSPETSTAAPRTPAATPSTPAATSPTATSPSATPPTRLALTQDDSGRTVTLAVGGVARLRLTDSARWAEAVADGAAVTLVPVDHESDPGFREWEVRAARAGRAAVRVGEQGGGPGVRIGFRVVAGVAAVQPAQR
ncbi:hypothetical protein ACH4SP_08845 [Streptomyces sp. NPDC021093]|uniref:hypothetical protein n=1 Tax=Streptomyces sp. NPDC021093 TaxID=3365112 RepID=UPI0037A30BF5